MKSFGGIVIMASHNTPKDNGYKTYGKYGFQSVLNGTDVSIEYIKGVEDIFDIEADENK